jgi:signal transduction histidine kinase
MGVWSMLTRFKTELVRQSAERFKTLDHESQLRIAEHGLDGLYSIQAWLQNNSSQYAKNLTMTMEGLIVRERDIAPAAELATQRVEQIGSYLKQLIAGWEKLRDAPSFRTAFIAFAQSIWPYYCVTFEPHLKAAGEGLNFCTWVADAELLNVVCCPAITSRKDDAEPVNPTLRLCPSLDDCFETAGATGLRRVLDIASQHRLDFEHIEKNLGHVQQLAAPHQIHRQERIFGRTDGAEWTSVPAPFTDLFHFNAATYRYLVKDGNKTVGVMFLASPAAECLQALVSAKTGSSGISYFVPRAWSDAGGELFARTMHRDFAGLRDEFNLLDQSARAAVYGDVSHNMKNLLASIAGLMRMVQDPSINADQRRAAAQIAEYTSTYAGQEFGLKATEFSMLEVRSLLERLTDADLLMLVKLDFRRQLIARQAIDTCNGRKYVIDGDPVDFVAMPIDDVIDDTRNQLVEIYRRIGDTDRAEKLAATIELRLEKDPICLPIALICREIINNMRPRVKAHEHTTLDIRFEKSLFRTERWRCCRLTQTMNGTFGGNPFEGADSAPSIERFNNRLSDQTTGIASMSCKIIPNVSTGQQSLEIVLSFPLHSKD